MFVDGWMTDKWFVVIIKQYAESLSGISSDVSKCKRIFIGPDCIDYFSLEQSSTMRGACLAKMSFERKGYANEL